MSEPLNPFFEDLRPEIEALARKVDAYPSAVISGFVFCQEPPAMLHITTIDNKGDDLIRLHLIFSTMVAEMQEQRYPQVAFVEISCGDKPVGGAPDEIAYQLAKNVLIISDDYRLQELATRYLTSRSPNGPDKNKA